MESIITALKDPGEWFKPIFFWLVILAIQKAYQKVPSGIKGVTRKNRLNRLKKISRERRSDFHVYSAINRSHANYTLFMLLSVGYLFGILFTPIRQVANTSIPLGILFGAPVIGFEVAWLLSDSYATALIKARHSLIQNRMLKV